jgi:hypothetical protein
LTATTSAANQTVTVTNTLGTDGSVITVGAVLGNTVTTGTAGDTVNISTAGSNINTGIGNDTIQVTNINALNGVNGNATGVLQTINGGTGTADVLAITTAQGGTINLSATNTNLALSGVEILTLGTPSTADLVVTLPASGLTQVTGTADTGKDITINATASAFAALTTVNLATTNGVTPAVTISDTGAVVTVLSANTYTAAPTISYAAASSLTATIAVNLPITGTSATTDVLNIAGDINTTISSTGIEIYNVSVAQTGLTVAASATTINASAGGTFTLGSATADTFTGTGSTAYAVTTAGGNHTITGGSGADTVTVSSGGLVDVTLGAGADTVVITAGTGAVRVRDFDFGGAAANDKFTLTASAATILATNGTTDVDAAINAGNFVFTSIAADTAVADALTTVAYRITSGADDIAVALTATAATFATAIAAQLADGAADISANYANGEGYLGLIANDANADGTVDSYVIYEFVQSATGAGVTGAAEIKVVAILDGTDAANWNSADFN